MNKFKSINYSRIVCEDCHAETIIEPGREFGGLNCNCKEEPPKGLDTEISSPVQSELDYQSTLIVTVIGRFENGDYEMCNNNDLSDTWRVPKNTFETTYEVKTNETPKTKATNEKTDGLSKGGDPLVNTVTLSLEDIKDKTPEEIATAYHIDELRALAKVVKIKSSHNMKEITLIGKLLEKVE